VDGGYFHRAYCRLSQPVIPLFRAASLAGALAGSLLFFGLAGITQQPVHHWRLSNSNRCAKLAILYYQ
jgi:hypothetical protein